MDEQAPIALNAVVVDEVWDRALAEALAQVKGISADVIFMFVNVEFADHIRDIVRIVRQETGTPILLGCSGLGIIGGDQELEDLPAVSLLALSLPGATLQPVRLTPQMVEDATRPQDWHQQLGVKPQDVNSWLIFADPLQMDCESLLDGLAQAYPGTPIVGGLASTDLDDCFTHLFLNEEIYEEGGVALALSGEYTIVPLVSQGCDPIGEPWTITQMQENGLIEGISNRSAYQMLIETFQSLSPDIQRRAQHNLLVGLAADEYQDQYTRGSFLIRQLLGVDRRTGSLAIGALPRVGQTIQFQLRDATSANRDLRTLLAQTKQALGAAQPIAALLCTCNGRGVGMFGMPDHDVSVITSELGNIPMAGLFCNGEIGPLGKRSFLHSFTACLALLVKKTPERPGRIS
jgi:small ligand-binding sensory domain FIST